MFDFFRLLCYHTAHFFPSFALVTHTILDLEIVGHNHVDMTGLPSFLASLSMEEIVDLFPPATFSHYEKRSRPRLEHAISLLSDDFLSRLPCFAQSKTALTSTQEINMGITVPSNTPPVLADTDLHFIQSLTKREIIDALPPETFLYGERKTRSQVERATLLLNKDLHTTLKQAMLTKKKTED